MIHVTDNLIFHLANSRISYVFRVSNEGLLEHIHFGGYVAPSDQYPSMPRRVDRGCVSEFQGIRNYNHADVPMEFPVFGSSDDRFPLFHAINSDGNSVQQFIYIGHEILRQKPNLEGLPSARGDDSETLQVCLQDPLSKITVRLCYTIYQHHDVIAKSATIINNGSQPICLSHAMSTCLNLPADDYELLHLHGSWARELNAERIAVPHGRFVIDSAVGTSGNTHNPFLAIMPRSTNEQFGRVYGCALVYSGNFAIHVEKAEFEAVRVSCGINPFNFSWKLDANDEFVCPEALLATSAQGLNGMSQTWHAFINQAIVPRRFCGQPRPSYLNSWEAAYFDIDEQGVLALAERAVDLGLDMLVVDDGWFEGRNDDTSSLGDWTADRNKFPDGLNQVAAQVKAKGLKFGLWLEPEMVSPNSKLSEAHPDWIIRVPGRIASTGRNQWLLDMSRQEVQDHLFTQIDRLLANGNIDYVKWDMNRTMTEVGSAALTADRQLETPHRYLLGVYALLRRLVQKYPRVLFENCASGGNRFDLGMLHYMSQCWISDMSEPIGRLPIQHGASYLFPPSVMASYIAPVPSHLNGRIVSLKTRALAGFFCAARGLSLNLSDIDADLEDLEPWIRLYKQSAQHVVSGQFYRLVFAKNDVCWQLNSADGGTIYLAYFRVLAAPNLPLKKVQLQDLEGDKNYHLQGSSLTFAGDALMEIGLDLPYVCAFPWAQGDYLDDGDFDSHLFVFRRV